MSLNGIGYAILLVVLGCTFGYYAASGASNTNNIEQNTIVSDQNSTTITDQAVATIDEQNTTVDYQNSTTTTDQAVTTIDEQNFTEPKTEEKPQDRLYTIMYP